MADWYWDAGFVHPYSQGVPNCWRLRPAINEKHVAIYGPESHEDIPKGRYLIHYCDDVASGFRNLEEAKAVAILYAESLIGGSDG